MAQKKNQIPPRTRNTPISAKRAKKPRLSMWWGSTAPEPGWYVLALVAMSRVARYEPACSGERASERLRRGDDSEVEA